MCQLFWELQFINRFNVVEPHIWLCGKMVGRPWDACRSYVGHEAAGALTGHQRRLSLALLIIIDVAHLERPWSGSITVPIIQNKPKVRALWWSVLCASHGDTKPKLATLEKG